MRSEPGKSENWGRPSGGTDFLIARTGGGFTVPIRKAAWRGRENVIRRRLTGGNKNAGASNHMDIFCYGEGKNDAGKSARMCLANSGERRKSKRHAENSQNTSVTNNEQHNLRSFGYGADLKTANFPCPFRLLKHAPDGAAWRVIWTGA